MVAAVYIVATDRYVYFQHHLLPSDGHYCISPWQSVRIWGYTVRIRHGSCSQDAIHTMFSYYEIVRIHIDIRLAE